MLQDQGMYKPVIHVIKTKYFKNQQSQSSFANSYINLNVHLKFKANDLKGVQVMGKINLQCKSSSYIQSNVHIKLKVAVLIEYI